MFLTELIQSISFTVIAYRQICKYL